VPQRGNSLTRFVGQSYLFVTGWRIEGCPPNLPKFVLIVAPHTSNWDFMVGMAIMFATGLRLAFMAKHSLFWEPLGTYMRWLGAFRIDRRASSGSVGVAVEELRARDKLILAVTPEGTRQKVVQWKTGFYHIAAQSGLPIVPLAFDYGRRAGVFGDPVWPSGDMAADVDKLKAFYAPMRGKYPGQY
jgi:1-acyl-sn-glycerol-3-phosphate acyltransferase